MLNTIIIDDDILVITYLKKLFKKLSNYGINLVGTALNLEDGIELINQKNPDLVFLDINLPGKTIQEIMNQNKLSIQREKFRCDNLKTLARFTNIPGLTQLNSELKEEQSKTKNNSCR